MRWAALLVVTACASAPVERQSAEEVLGARTDKPVAEASPELLSRLQDLVRSSEAQRARTARGAPMPEPTVEAWSIALDSVEALTQTRPSMLDLVRARLWVQTTLEADGAHYGDIPAPLALRTQRCLANLSARLVGNRRHVARANPASFVWPVDPVVVTSGWGDRLHPVHGDYRFHAGVDLEAVRAQQVYAASSGVVTFAGWNAGHGKQVELQHDAHLSTRYSHLSGFSVQVGETVKRGDVLGLAGKTGTATGVHLHFELLRDGIAIDPEVELPSPGGLMVTR